MQSVECVHRFVRLSDACVPELAAELWSVFIGVVRKSQRNLEVCIDADLTLAVLDRLSSGQLDAIVADLLIELLTALTQYSVSVKEMKRVLQMLELDDAKKWRAHAGQLLRVVRNMPRKDGPDVFFSLTGGGIALPPFKQWPHLNGWSFAAWLRLDPPTGTIYERERPVIYS